MLGRLETRRTQPAVNAQSRFSLSGAPEVQFPLWTRRDFLGGFPEFFSLFGKPFLEGFDVPHTTPLHGLVSILAQVFSMFLRNSREIFRPFEKSRHFQTFEKLVRRRDAGPHGVDPEKAAKATSLPEWHDVHQAISEPAKPFVERRRLPFSDGHQAERTPTNVS
ncbi:hypothetical protein [Bradyrhizobium sp. 930_D9_N1_4]|uniref:hypothetical protein n=1 Tax=Bradyrhizobium sp. 930_D9_N1_4 TaxID=3240374 RepID=UPI003F8CCE61